MRQSLQRYLPELVLLASAGAFAVLLAELIILDHFEGVQNIAPAAATAGIVLCVLAVVLRGRGAVVVAALFALIALAGVIGVYRHLDEREGSLSLSIVTTAFAHDGDDHDEDDDHDHDDDEDHDHEPPPLAPLGLSGSAMLSALAALAIRRVPSA